MASFSESSLSHTIEGNLHPTLRLKWVRDGFDNPECGVLDPGNNQIYLSNMASSFDIITTDSGYISRLSLDGEILEERWITGLKNPCGMHVRGNRLFVVDSDRLCIFAIDTGLLLNEYAAPGAGFLDGTAADESGENIFVSDIVKCVIWRLNGKTWGPWVADPRLNFPDGMVAEKNRLVVGTYGLWEGCHHWKPGTNEDFMGHLVAVDYDSRNITDIGDGTAIAHHDGLTVDGGDGYVTSDFIYNKLIHIDRNGKTEEIAHFGPKSLSRPARSEYVEQMKRYGNSRGPADLRYYPDRRILLVPFVNSGEFAVFDYDG